MFLYESSFQVLCSSYSLFGVWYADSYKIHSITSVVQRYGSGFYRCLPALHAFTECDSVSAFSGKGKLAALKLVKRNPELEEAFQQLGRDIGKCPMSCLQGFKNLHVCCSPQVLEQMMSTCFATVSSVPRKGIRIEPVTTMQGHSSKAL